MTTDDVSGAPQYRLDIKYIGTGFQGWQTQPDGSGVQDHMLKAMATFFRHPVRLTGSSRTDTGVHAERQVAVFRTPVPLDERRWLKSLNALLPSGIGITAVAPVGPDFHPVRDALAKTYRYMFWTGMGRNPMLWPFVWPVWRQLDTELMARELRCLEGVHDFTSFCAADSGARTRVREILSTMVVAHGPLTEVWITGRGFLKQMVRAIAGSLYEKARSPDVAPGLAAILAARDRTVAGATAPGQGLCLVDIHYENPVPHPAELRARSGAPAVSLL